VASGSQRLPTPTSRRANRNEAGARGAGFGLSDGQTPDEGERAPPLSQQRRALTGASALEPAHRTRSGARPARSRRPRCTQDADSPAVDLVPHRKTIVAFEQPTALVTVAPGVIFHRRRADRSPKPPHCALFRINAGSAGTTGSGSGQPTGIITSPVASAGTVPLITPAVAESLTLRMLRGAEALPPPFPAERIMDRQPEHHQPL